MRWGARKAGGSSTTNRQAAKVRELRPSDGRGELSNAGWTLLLRVADSTLPIRLWAMIRVGFNPSIKALVSLILVTSFAIAFVAVRRLRIAGIGGL